MGYVIIMAFINVRTQCRSDRRATTRLCRASSGNENVHRAAKTCVHSCSRERSCAADVTIMSFCSSSHGECQLPPGIITDAILKPSCFSKSEQLCLDGSLHGWLIKRECLLERDWFAVASLISDCCLLRANFARRCNNQIRLATRVRLP